MDTTICRACLRHGKGEELKMTDLFSNNSTEHTTNALLLGDMLAICTSINVQPDDGLPAYICSSCISTLITAYTFKIECDKSNKWLLEHYLFRKVKDEINHGNETFKCNLPIEIERICFNSKDNEDGIFYNADVKVEPNVNLKADTDDENCDINSIENIVTDKKNCDDIEDNLTIGQLTKCVKKKKIGTTKVKFKKSQVTKTLKCEQCPKLFAFPHMLRKHMETHIHSGMKSYFCPICEKYYKSEVDHNKVHKNKARFMCDVCSKRFDTKQKVQSHLETHSANRPKNFLCAVSGCGKAYLSVQGLNRHKILHSGTKNFLCHLCSKAFADKAGLLLHMPFHFNERNYKCRFCGKEFFTPSNRNQHEQRHSSERRFPCGQCERRFHNRVALNRHMLTHTNELQHQCAFCPKKFARMDNKKRHELVIHGYCGNRDKNVIIEHV